MCARTCECVCVCVCHHQESYTASSFFREFLTKPSTFHHLCGRKKNNTITVCWKSPLITCFNFFSIPNIQETTSLINKQHSRILYLNCGVFCMGFRGWAGVAAVILVPFTSVCASPTLLLLPTPSYRVCTRCVVSTLRTPKACMASSLGD